MFFSNTHPQSLTTWPLPTIVTDAGLWRFFSSGIGSPLVRKRVAGLTKEHADSHRSNDCFELPQAPAEAMFCADLRWMAGYATRPSFERYGATVFWGAPGPKGPKLLEIHRPANAALDFTAAPEPGRFEVYRPPSKRHPCNESDMASCKDKRVLNAAHRWEHAKWVARVSVMAEVTLIDHLLWAHLTVSNGVSAAAYATLEPSHRIRQLLKPFTFRANTINTSAYMTLIAEV